MINSPDLLGKKYLENQQYQEAIRFYQQAIAEDEFKLNNYWYLGLAYLLNGEEEKAEEVWMSVLFEVDDLEQSLTNLLQTLREQAITNLQKNRWQIGLIIYQKMDELLSEQEAIAIEFGLDYYNYGIVLEKNSEQLPAIQAYQKAIEINPNLIDAYNNLGNIYQQQGNLQSAILSYQKAIAINPKHYGSYFNLGNAYAQENNYADAIKMYRKALELEHSHLGLIENLATALTNNHQEKEACLYFADAAYYRGQYPEAINLYQKYLSVYQGDCELYLRLAKCHLNLNQPAAIHDVYQQALQANSQQVNLHLEFICLLRNAGYTAHALQIADQAKEILPDNLTLKLESLRILPIIYQTESEIEQYRTRFKNKLDDLIATTDLSLPTHQQQALIGISKNTNFYLQYQGKNDLILQKQYGEYMHQVMQASYPQWCQPIAMPSLANNEKIRIGYISDSMRNHTVGQLSLGWFKHHHREDFEIYAYYTNPQANDVKTHQFKSYSDRFYHIPNDLEAICHQIKADNLHILVFIDIGMCALVTQIAALRLAPIQCTTWCHPITSGIPTIDYFLSSDLMEPDQGETHYTEKLVRLPNIGISYTQPEILAQEKKRTFFQLRDDAIVYLCCQSLYKYLPQYDYILPAIAQRVPQAQFFFLANPQPHNTEIIIERMRKAFAEFNLDSQDYCVFSPRIYRKDYLNLNLLADIFLDSIAWSGGNTTLEAIACNLPVVTYPHLFMRGRHSYGILQMLQVTETIASSEEEYIDIAVKLAQDKSWRESLVAKIKTNHDLLYDDLECIEALEKFYSHLVRNFPSINE